MTEVVHQPSVDHDSLTHAVQSAIGNLPQDPSERAQERLSRLRSSFASTLAIVAEMHRDHDWEYLFREDGTQYQSLAEVCADTLDVSMAMARRYVQGARDFYLPLSEITVEGTRIEINSKDVAALGRGGISEAVETAREGLEGVSDPEEASGVIDGAVESAKSARANHDDEFTDDGGGGAPSPPSPRPPMGDFDGDAMGDLPDEGDEFTEDALPEPAPDLDVPLEDPVLAVLDGATDYTDPENLDGLDEPLRSICAALNTLAEMTPDQAAKLVSYETRGVLLPISQAQTNATRFRVLVETLPWYMSRMGT